MMSDRSSSAPALIPENKKIPNNCFDTVLYIIINSYGAAYYFTDYNFAYDFTTRLENISQKKIPDIDYIPCSRNGIFFAISVRVSTQEFDNLWGESALAQMLSALSAQNYYSSSESSSSLIFKHMEPHLLKQFLLLRTNGRSMFNILMKKTWERKIKIEDGIWLLEKANDILSDPMLVLSTINAAFPFFINFFNHQLSTEKSIHLFLGFENFYPLFTNIYLKVKYLSTIIERSDIVQALSKKNSQLSCIHLYDGGWSEHVWPHIAESLILDAPPSYRHSYQVPNTITNSKTKPLEGFENFSNFINQSQLAFLKVQGRTILFENNDRIFAVKIKKQNESQEELEKEYNTLLYFKNNKKKLRLQSDLPTPIGVGKVNGVLDGIKPHLTNESLASLIIMVGDTQSHSAYFYQVDRQCDYFTYLHNPCLSDEAFKDGNEKAISDLFHLLGNGIVFSQLTDLFHNIENPKRSDGGRYLVLVDLLRDLDQKGSGRLTNWKEAIAYPNLRGSGLADLGDHLSVENFTYKSYILDKNYSDASRFRSIKAGNFVLANIMAEYQYVLFLIAGLRGCQLTESANSKENAKEIWRTLALQVVRNCALAISIVTSQSQFTAYHFLSSIINVDRLAKQMQYWMTDAYIADVSQNKIDKEIYGEDVHVVINKEKFRKGTFNHQLGFSIDGKHADLGPVNGQEPIKEANKLFYWMVIMIFQSYQEMTLSLQNLKSISREKDILKAEEIRKHSFTHLTTKSYHAIQLELCKQLVKKPDLPEEIKEKVRNETEDHRRNWAAATISIFWRQRKTHYFKLATQDNLTNASTRRCNGYRPL